MYMINIKKVFIEDALECVWDLNHDNWKEMLHFTPLLYLMRLNQALRKTMKRMCETHSVLNQSPFELMTQQTAALSATSGPGWAPLAYDKSMLVVQLKRIGAVRLHAISWTNVDKE